MTQAEQKQAAKEFAEEWNGKGYEKGETARFWIDLLQNVYGVSDATKVIFFEESLEETSFTESQNDVSGQSATQTAGADATDGNSLNKRQSRLFVDCRIPSTSVMIEQKSIGKDLRKPIKQSDGTFLTPFQQAKRYVANLPRSEHPKWIVTCNFEEFLIYNMENPNAEPESLLLKDLHKEYYRLQFLVDTGSDNVRREEEVSVEAARRVGLLYDALYKQYGEQPSAEELKSLNALCVRLVFCLYAEDAGIFGHHAMFHDYMKSFKPENARTALIELFKMLDTKIADRDKFADDKLLAFPYVNGGLFADEKIIIPRFNDEILTILLKDCSEDFDWSAISPTIFGATFESTLNPQTRRSGGMHYTSIQNIHKVIDPLFLNSLKYELEQIQNIKAEKPRIQKALDFQTKIASLKFFDPACGSGNFLTESYMSLRRLENEAIRISYKGEASLGLDTDIKVSIKQFYGIEINDFAVSVAKTALWIAESQMLAETVAITGKEMDFLPLKSYTNIFEGNALCKDWNEVVPSSELSYIMGNPPFVGARLMSAEQKEDLLSVFGKDWKNIGNMDYVCGWYKKAFELINTTGIKAALVSTNSITQGEQVANLWKPLFEQGLHFDFAYRTFRWDSESALKAHVHCVIVGFSCGQSPSEKIIYDESGRANKVKNINGYLVDADNVFIESRNKPLCAVPEIGIGNKPIDGGNYLFTKEEMEEFVKKEPASHKYFKPWYGSDEFINNRPRYCLWLGDCAPGELRKMKHCMERVENVRNFRLASKSAPTQKLADTPTHFHVENMPNDEYILIPRVSSEKRRYIPIGFMKPGTLCSDSVHVLDCSQFKDREFSQENSLNSPLGLFGILTSNVHMAWMRAVAGRLEMRYRYSKDIVYNNFPWCNPTAEQKAKIEQTAQGILDARAKYMDATLCASPTDYGRGGGQTQTHGDCASNLADLYDEITMPSDLRKAHQENDKAVMAAYGFDMKMTESECVAELMKMYQKLSLKSEK